MTRIALVLVLLLLAAGGYWLLRGADDPPPDRAESRTGSAAAPAAPEAVAMPAPAPLADASAGQRSEAAPPEGDRLPLPDDASWLEVAVVDGTTGEPVAGAHVVWSDNRVWPRLHELPQPERQTLREDAEAVAERFGWRTRSDGNGIARVAVGPQGGVVHARSGAGYGSTQVGGMRVPLAGWRVELHTDATLYVQVLDASGLPAAGVRVGIHAVDPAGRPASARGYVQTATSAGPDGIATFRHLQSSLPFAPAGSAWRAAAAIPGNEDPGVPFAAESPPVEPLVLRLPPTGSVLARLLHAGAPQTGDVSFSVVFAGQDQRTRMGRAVGVTADDDGWARFPRVAVGVPLLVLATSVPATLSAESPGLTSPGEELRVELTTERCIVVTGRVVMPDGAPLANATPTVDYRTDLRSGHARLRTGADGRFTWILGERRGGEAKLDTFVLSYVRQGGDTLRAPVGSRDLVVGENALGDVMLREGAVLAAGTFVFEPPSARARVEVVVEVEAPGRTRDGTPAWSRLPAATPVYRPDGTFEVRGEPGAGRHRLRCTTLTHLPVDPIEFVPGTRDLRIAVALGHDLTAHCLVDPADGLRQLRARLRAAGAPARANRERTTFEDRFTARSWEQVAGRATLRWLALPAGVYTLTIEAPGVPAPLAVIGDVVVPAPEGGDPRLAAVDLRATLRSLRLTVTLAPPAREGAAAASTRTHVFVLPQADDADWEGHEHEGDGPFVIPVPPGRVELLVWRDGCRPARVAGVEREANVELAPWPEQELVFAGAPELPRGATLHVSATPAVRSGASNRRFRTGNSSGSLDGFEWPTTRAVEVKDGRARVAIGDGPARLTVSVRAGRRSRALRTVAPDGIAGPAPGPIVVQIDGAEVQRALAELQKQPAVK